MENYREYDSVLSRWIDRKLTQLVERRTEEYVRRYAVDEDGMRDEQLADLIRYEVRRRGHMSLELDVFEPIRWTGISTILGVVGGIAVHRMIGEKSLQKLAGTGAATGAMSAAISLIRPYFRFDAALYGGAQTALGIYDDKYGLKQSPGSDYLDDRKDQTASERNAAWVEREQKRELTDQSKDESPVR